MHPARGLKAWEAADQLADAIRDALSHLPRHRRGNTYNQLLKAADSIGSNISEGSGRRTKADQRQFYHVGLGSAKETLNWLRRSRRERLIDSKAYFRLSELTAITHKLLDALIRSLAD